MAHRLAAHPLRAGGQAYNIMLPANAVPGAGNEIFSCAPLMRPPVVTALMRQAAKKTLLLAPVFMDNLAPEQRRTDPNYVAIVASFCVPAMTGGRGERSTAITVQACAVGYRQEDCGTVAQAKAAVSAGIKAGYNLLPAAIREQLLREGNPPAWVENNDPIPDDALEFIIEQASELPSQQAVTLSVFTTALLGFCKQGTVTNSVLNKVTNAARDELNVTIQLDSNTIRSFWNMVGHWYTPAAARIFFARWEVAIGEACLRFRLLCQQASWTGMTNYQNIMLAKDRYPDFFWNKCYKMFPADFGNYALAVAAVGRDEYYGYRRDLGPAKSTLYPNLSYVAYSLLMVIGGERSLREFLGTNRNTPFASQIDVLIREYETARVESLREEPTQEHTDAAIAFRALAPPPV